VEPVEYKAGTKHGRSAEIQLCAQALCLEEMLGTTVTAGHVWYASPRKRERVEIDAGLRALTIEAIAAIRRSFQAAELPPAVNDRRCEECQLRALCLPEIVADPGRVSSYVQREVMSCE
jgi:CRISPR-associated exonuclease Cas4